MSKTSDRKPETHVNILMDYNSPWDAVIPNNDATNSFISGLGIVFNHYVAIPNVIHEANIGDLRRTFHEEDSNEFVNSKKFDFIENGFLYKYAGQVWGIFQGNNKSFRELASGLYSDSGAFVTFNRYYRGTNKYASFAEFDKLIPCISGSEFFSVNWEKTTANPTGINRLQFPACEIEHIIDNRGQEYIQGKDFKLESGYIRWIDSAAASRPGIDPMTGKSRVMAIRYKYKPTFYVRQLAHDIRITPTFNEQGDLINGLEVAPNGDIKYTPGPTSVAIVADFVFLDRRTPEPNEIDAQLDTEDDGGNVGPR
jgi:hypothetical protein